MSNSATTAAWLSSSTSAGRVHSARMYGARWGELTWLVGRDQTQHGEQLLHDTPWEYRAEIRSANQPILESRLGG